MTDTGEERNRSHSRQWRPQPRVARPQLTGAGAMFSVETPNTDDIAGHVNTGVYALQFLIIKENSRWNVGLSVTMKNG